MLQKENFVEIANSPPTKRKTEYIEDLAVSTNDHWNGVIDNAEMLLEGDHW